VSVVNRRNAVIGWGVWKVAKRIVRRKTKSSDGPPKKSLVALGIAALAGAVTFWRSRSGGDES
jgi:hypothetical protein